MKTPPEKYAHALLMALSYIQDALATAEATTDERPQLLDAHVRVRRTWEEAHARARLSRDARGRRKVPTVGQ